MINPTRISTQWLLLVSLACVAALSGCSRAHYRRQADNEAYALVQQKANHPHWALDNYTIAIDPRSRMFDPNSPDRPPMPPDDPTAHQLMHAVDGKKGYPGWHDNGDIPYVENPAWPAYIEVDDQGVLTVNADDAVRLALLHSRAYQQELETLYLSALDVSFERFRFDVQGFAGASLFYTADGPRRGLRNGVGNSSSDLTVSTFSNDPTRALALRKAFSTGATLVVDMANSLVWQFSGPDDYAGNTIIDFALFQPLLRGAGRDRVLERLTVSERTLLANVRAMERYRLAFNVTVMTGRNAEQGPNRQGGVFGSGLEGFSGIGGGFGGVTGGGGGNANTGSGGGAAPQAGGFIGLLQDQQQIRNQEGNVERLRSNLFRSEQFLEELRTRAGDPALINDILRQDLQVAQSRQALLNAESNLLTARSNYQTSLDTFKSTLGLPPQVCMQISDDMLDQFQLIDSGTVNKQELVDRVISQLGDVRLQIAAHIESSTVVDPNDPTRTTMVRTLPWYPELPQHLEQLRSFVPVLREARQGLLEEEIPRTQQDIEQFAGAISRRKEWLQKLQARIESEKDSPCPLLPIPSMNQDIFNVARLDQTRVELSQQLAVLEGKIDREYGRHLDLRDERLARLIAEGETYSPEKLFDELYNGVLYPRRTAGNDGDQITDILVVAPGDLLALQLVQARARAESIELAPVDIKAEQALEVARKYRRDWMNARQALVDRYRLIEFNADNLESTLDVFFSGDVRNQTDNPFALRSGTGRLRVGVQFDAPITRLSERNTYRQSLIEYQQARRNYYNFEDSVARTLRAELRTVQTNQINFELQRLAVLEAARQIDRNEDIRINQELTGQAAGVTAARDAVSALSDLLNAQNSFLAFWVNYEVLRRSLDLDLGTLQLDSEGLWIDPGKIGEDYGTHDPWLWRTCIDPELGPGEQPAYDSLETLPPGIQGPAAEPGDTLPPPQGQDISEPAPKRSVVSDELPDLELAPALRPKPVYGPIPSRAVQPSGVRS